MQFFTFFRRKSLRPSWEFSTQGVLWRLHPAPGSKFVGEERDLASRTATFFCLDAETGVPLWRGEKFGDGWWTGLSGIFRGVLLLHGFATPDLPEEKKIIAVDLLSGRELWRNDEFTFLGVKDGIVIGSRRTQRGREIARMTLLDGSIEGVVGPEEGPFLPREADDDERGGGDTRYPVTIEAAEGQSLPMRDLLRGARPDLANEGPLEYLEHGAAVVFGHAVAEASAGSGTAAFASLLTVVEKATGRTLYRDTLERSLPFPARGSIMMRGRFLYYIRDRRTITAVAMHSSRQAFPTNPSVGR